MTTHGLALITAELPDSANGGEPLQALQQFLLTGSLVNTAKCQK